jgi:hypothetical protein
MTDIVDDAIVDDVETRSPSHGSTKTAAATACRSSTTEGSSAPDRAGARSEEGVTDQDTRA